MKLDTEWTVYLVDDDDDDALFFEMAVHQTHSDCKVRRFANREDFINNLGVNIRPAASMIFLDLALPSLSGIEILHQVRTLPFSSHLPVFILSGSQPPDAVSQAYEAGVAGYLLKPAYQDQWDCTLKRSIHFAKKLLTIS